MNLQACGCQETVGALVNEIHLGAQQRNYKTTKTTRETGSSEEKGRLGFNKVREIKLLSGGDVAKCRPEPQYVACLYPAEGNCQELQVSAGVSLHLQPLPVYLRQMRTAVFF